MRLLLSTLALLPTLLLPCTALAGEGIQPLAQRSDNPVLRLLGVPRASGSVLLAPGSTAATLDLTEANHFTFAARGDEEVAFDGETSVAELTLRRRLGDGPELALHLPWVAHHGGVLDSVIDRWHDTFGFGTLGRDRLPRDRVELRHSEGGLDRLRLDRARQGPGDLGVQVRWPWQRRHGHWALVAGLTLPTGSASQLAGAGTATAHLAVAGSMAAPQTRWGWGLYGGAGVLLAGDASRVDNRPVVPFGHLGASLALAARWQVLVQVDASAPLVDSATSQLGDAVVALGTGLRWQPGPRTRVDAFVVEDLKGRSTPDVALHLGISHQLRSTR